MENYFNRHPDQIFRLGAHDHSLLQCSLNWSFCTIFDFTLLSDFRVGKEPPRDLIWKWEKSMNGVNEILVVILTLRMIWRYWWEGFELDTSECYAEDVWKVWESESALGWSGQREESQFQLARELCLLYAHWLISNLSDLVSSFVQSTSLVRRVRCSKKIMLGW